MSPLIQRRSSDLTLVGENFSLNEILTRILCLPATPARNQNYQQTNQTKHAQRISQTPNFSLSLHCPKPLFTKVSRRNYEEDK